MLWVCLKFAVCTVIILFCGQRVAKYGDAIAEKTGLGGLWIGVILVSIATSLPEFFTGIGSTVFVDAPDLTVGNLFGANSYNLVNIVILDFLNKETPLLNSVAPGHLLTALLSLIPLSIAAVGIFYNQELAHVSLGHVSIFSILIFLSYIAATKVIYTFEKNKPASAGDAEMPFKYDKLPLKTAYLRYGLSALAIAGAGIWLAYIGDEIAMVTGLGKTFIGSLFLSFATTLPEITVSVSALRLGAKDIAVANMLGSNLFNMTIILSNDVCYLKAPIFSTISQQHIATALVVIVMTAIVGASIILRPKKKTALGLSVYSFLLLAVFLAGAFLNFSLSRH